jgi:hypothetical protein
MSTGDRIRQLFHAAEKRYEAGHNERCAVKMDGIDCNCGHIGLGEAIEAIERHARDDYDAFHAECEAAAKTPSTFLNGLPFVEEFTGVAHRYRIATPLPEAKWRPAGDGGYA